jgi:hypothetical protein
MLEPVKEGRGKGGSPGVAASEVLELPDERFFEGSDIHLELPQDGCNLSLRVVEKLHKEVLPANLVMTAVDAQSDRRLERFCTVVIKFLNENPQVVCYHDEPSFR